VKGRQRHLLVDALGLLIAVVVTAASVQDRDGAKLVFDDARGETRLGKDLGRRGLRWQTGGIDAARVRLGSGDRETQ